MKARYLLTLFVIFMMVIVSAASTTLVLTDPGAIGSTGTASAAQSYIGMGSWANNDAKFAAYLTPQGLFGYAFTIDDIANITYHTYKDTPQNGLNFYLSIYTEPYVGGWASGYGQRLTLEPLYSANFTDVVGAWNAWSTSAGTNQLRIFDSNNGPYGFYTAPFLSDLQAGPIDWSSYNVGGSGVIDYSVQTVKYIVVDTGSGWTAGFDAYVDGVTVTLLNGDSTTVDFDIAITADDCKDGGWQAYGIFRNQGECVSAANSNRGGN